MQRRLLPSEYLDLPRSQLSRNPSLSWQQARMPGEPRLGFPHSYPVASTVDAAAATSRRRIDEGRILALGKYHKVKRKV